MSDTHLLCTLDRVIHTESSAYGGPSTERCENAWRILDRLKRHKNEDAQTMIDRLQSEGFGRRDGKTVREGASV